MAIFRLSTAARNAAAEAVVALLDAGTGPGYIEFRTGSLPASPQTAASGTLLGTVTLDNPAGGTATAGQITIADPASVVGVGDGDAGWARLYDSDANPVIDCDVTATGGGGTITLDTVTISTGINIDIGALTYVQPNE